MVRLFKSKNSRLFYIETVTEGHPEDFSYVREGDLFSIDRLNTKILEVNKASYTLFLDELGEPFENADIFEQYLVKSLESDRVLTEEDIEAKYEPSTSFNATDVGDRGINETFTIDFSGIFLDYISQVLINDNQEIMILEQSFDNIKIQVTTNNKIQTNIIGFVTPKSLINFSFETKDIESVIPSTTGSAEYLWRQPSPVPSNNEVTLTEGRFEAEQNNGEGWNNHAYYGNFSGNFSRISHQFTTRNNTNAYCYINFSNQITATTSGSPRVYISNATTLQYYDDTGNFGGSSIIKQDDVIRVDFTSSTMEVFVNGDRVYQDSGNYSVAMQNSYVNLTSFRFTILEDIITRKFN